MKVAEFIIEGHSESTFVVEGGGGEVLKKRTKTNKGKGEKGGGGQAYLYVHSVKKIA